MYLVPLSIRPILRFIRNIQTMDHHQRTFALYQHDDSLCQLATKVVSVEPISALTDASRVLFRKTSDRDYVVSTSETIFYAQGGGQPSDTGTMQSENTENPVSFEVSVVRTTTDGQILHLGRFVPSGTQTFVAGQSVKQAIDGVKRKLHSRIHTAGHIVGLAVRYLAESIPNVIELKAQHYPDSAFVEFRGLIEGKHKEAVQAQVDSFVQQTLPVKVYWWNQQELKEKCAVVPENVVIPDGGFVRAVDIEGAGAYPCGGTHVGDTSQVGKVELRRISRQKGVSKISYSVANA